MKLMKPMPAPVLGRRDFDTLFDRLMRSPLFPETMPLKAWEGLWEPALDFSETEKEYVIRLEVPGFHRENLDVKYENELLTIAGHREYRDEVKNENFIWKEREEGRFTRTLRVPAAVNEAKIEALYENGILTVKLPKTEAAPKARIAIK
ncbi:MAG TPA: Hsp20/alpha crystallin family protein [Gemmatimonadales bacterium]|nr:Hsp20/alpha crystallin family protein [Gemmatimonadales bacterium]